jgi:hypothetical protein
LLTFIPALSASEQGPLKPEDEAALEQEAAKLAEKPEFKEVKKPSGLSSLNLQGPGLFFCLFSEPDFRKTVVQGSVLSCKTISNCQIR